MVLPFRFTTAGNGIENGIAYLDDDDVVTEAEITYTEDGSILFRMPDAPTLAGEDVIASDAWKWKDGEVLYRYDIRIRDLTGDGLLINGAQVFVEYDGTLLALRDAESAWNWTVYEKNGKTFCYDRFTNRVMFPLIDVRGNVVGFAGRTLDPEYQGRKYLNSKDTLIFSKRSFVFGMNVAKKSKQGRIILCEGLISGLPMIQCFATPRRKRTWYEAVCRSESCGRRCPLR